MAFLDNTGLQYFWQKIKAYIDSKSGGGGVTEYSGNTNQQYDCNAGIVQDLSVLGQSYKWNQLIADGNFPSGTVYWQTHARCTGEINNNTATVTVTTADSTTYSTRLLVQDREFFGSHKYYIGFDVLASKTTSVKTYFIGKSGSNRMSQISVGTEWAHKRIVKDFPDASQEFKQFQITNGATTAVGDIFQFRNLQIVDLTALYGVGNEPTAEAFEQSDVYQAMYAAGKFYKLTALTGSIYSIESVGVRGRNLLDEPYSLTAIEAPLRSINDVHDELLVHDNSVTKKARIGAVDLGSLTWTADATGTTDVYRMYTAGISNFVKRNTSAAGVPNVLCVKYSAISPNNTWDKITGVTVGTDGSLRIYDPNYNTSSSAAAFKTAMQGVMLYYELADETEQALPDIPLIELGSAFSVLTELDSTFEMTAMASHMHKLADVEGLQTALDGKAAAADLPANMTASEANTGTATTGRAISAKVLHDYVAAHGSGGESLDSVITALEENVGDDSTQVVCHTFEQGFSIEQLASFLRVPEVLYNNATGTAGTVTLSKSAANYQHMRIYFMKSSDSEACGSVDIYQPNGKKASLVLANPYSTTATQFLGRVVSISGTQITALNKEAWANCASGITGGATDPSIYIFRVEAW